jgi:serine/threonine-protein kinase
MLSDSAGFVSRGLQRPDPATSSSYLNDVIITAGAIQPRIKPGIAIAVLRDGLSARSARHRKGIVHGDVEPSNIMLKRPATPRY